MNRYNLKMKIQFLASCLLLPMILAAQPKTAAVMPHLGKPTLFVDNKPVVPAFYALTHAYGGRWSWEEVASRNLKNFCETGINLFQVDLYFEDIWYKNVDTLDIGKARRQIKGVLDVCPGAGVVIRVHVNAPFWWNEQNPGERTEYADGPIDERAYGPPFNNEDGDIDRPLRASLASVKWKEESGKRLEEFCNRLAQTTEGNSVIGIHVCGGIYGEWHYWGFIDHDPDTGPAMTTYFRQWLKRKYKTDADIRKAWNNNTFTLATATVPSKDERDKTTAGIFRDPKKEQRVIDYFIAQQEVVAEDIEHFCRIVKETWPRPLIVGVFYGYFHMTFCRQASGGHLFVERILNCPFIDYLSAPQSYWGASRELGGSGNSRAVIESGLLHGKLWLDEVDNGFLQQSSDYDGIRITTRPDSAFIPILQRSALYPLMRGTGLWYYDFGIQKSFGWWDRPTYLQKIKEGREFMQKRIDIPFEPAADVLYVWDMESFYYVKNNWTPVCYNQLDVALEEVLRTGIAGDHIYLFDLDKVDLKRYRAVVFMNTYIIQTKWKEFILQRVAGENRTLIFNYMPGITNGTQLNYQFVSELTGLEVQPIKTETIPRVVIAEPADTFTFEGVVDPLLAITDKKAQVIGKLLGTDQTIVAVKKFKNYTSIYSSLPLHGTDVYRRLLREAGCHVYNTNGEFLYAHSGLLLLHSRFGGKRTIHLRNDKTVELTMPSRSTWILDANTGEVLIK